MHKVLITGSSRGIGEEIARKLKNSGYEVVLHGRSKSKKLLGLADELKASYITFDVSNYEEAKEALSKFQEPFYGIVLNAGITKDGTFAGLSYDEWKSVIDTNLGSFTMF